MPKPKKSSFCMFKCNKITHKNCVENEQDCHHHWPNIQLNVVQYHISSNLLIYQEKKLDESSKMNLSSCFTHSKVKNEISSSLSWFHITNTFSLSQAPYQQRIQINLNGVKAQVLFSVFFFFCV